MNSTPSLVTRAKTLVANPAFDVVMMTVILVNAVVLGLETFHALAAAHHGLFSTLNNVILGIYVVELLIRITACAGNPRVFAQDGWNIFDFLVVVASLVPWLRENAMLLRLIRLLRIVRIVRFCPTYASSSLRWAAVCPAWPPWRQARCC